MHRTIVRVFNVFLVILFATAAAVQYNDPDPALWMAIYGSVALCGILYLGDWLPFWGPTLLSAACVIGALYLLVQVVGGIGFVDPTGQEMVGVTESGREMLGLLFTAGGAAAFAYQVRRDESTREGRASRSQA